MGNMAERDWHPSQRSLGMETIPVALVHEELVEVRWRGHDVDRLLEDCGIQPAILKSQQARVSARQYSLLWHRITALLGCEFFGMTAQPMKPGSFTLLCHAVLHAGTLGRALPRALRFMNVVLDGFSARLVIERGFARIEIHESGAPHRAFTYGTYWMIIHGLSCWLVGRRIPIVETTFRCAEPPFASAYRTLFGSPRYGQPLSTLVISADALKAPIRRSEKSLKAFLRDAPADFLVKFRDDQSLTYIIRRRLRALPCAEWPEFDCLAEQLALSPTTLRRRLKGEGQSYTTIKDALRRDMAIGLLAQAPLSVQEVASLVGYDETSAFYRAFRKWTGAPPSHYRSEAEASSG